MWALLAACREPAGDQNRPPKASYVFEHKTYFILSHTPYTRTVVFCHISNIPLGFHSVKFVITLPGLNSRNICEMLLYDQQLVVLNYTLICVVRTAHH